MDPEKIVSLIWWGKKVVVVLRLCTRCCTKNTPVSLFIPTLTTLYFKALQPLILTPTPSLFL